MMQVNKNEKSPFFILNLLLDIYIYFRIFNNNARLPHGSLG